MLGLISLLVIFHYLFCQPARAQVVINEFLPKPSTVQNSLEWIELYNHSPDPVSLLGWQLDDLESGGTNPYSLPDITLPQAGFIVFNQTETKIGLNNDTDDVRLINPSGQVIDFFHYQNPPLDQAYARQPDGTGDFVLTANQTPNQSNVQTPEISPTLGLKPTNPTLSFSEIAACPADGPEWLEVKSSQNDTLPQNWSVRDLAGNQRSLAFSQPATFLTSQFTSAFMNNSGDTLNLIDPQGNVIETVSYTECHPQTTYSLINNSWQLTTAATPGKDNVLTIQPSTSPTLTPVPSQPSKTITPTHVPTSKPMLTSRSTPTANLDPSHKASNSSVLGLSNPTTPVFIPTPQSTHKPPTDSAVPTSSSKLLFIGGTLMLVSALIHHYVQQQTINFGH